MESPNETDPHSDACHFACAGGRNHLARRQCRGDAKRCPGWSVKRTILGQPVYNDNNERVGSIDDIIIAPDKAISYAIVNAGGFLGLAKHNVAVPVSKFKLVEGKLVLPGATKEALKASPEFQYAQ